MTGGALLIPFLISLNIQPIQRDTTYGCSSAHTTVQLEQCLQRNLAQEDTLLKRSETRVRRSLTEPAKAPFDSAAALWRVYRDQECKAVYSDYTGGSIAASQFAGCKIALSKARRSSLRLVYMADK
jgi:uncharacterized protein YecT (DUF1311 family)